MIYLTESQHELMWGGFDEAKRSLTSCRLHACVHGTQYIPMYNHKDQLLGYHIERSIVKVYYRGRNDKRMHRSRPFTNIDSRLAFRFVIRKTALMALFRDHAFEVGRGRIAHLRNERILRLVFAWKEASTC